MNKATALLIATAMLTACSTQRHSTTEATLTATHQATTETVATTEQHTLQLEQIIHHADTLHLTMQADSIVTPTATVYRPHFTLTATNPTTTTAKATATIERDTTTCIVAERDTMATIERDTTHTDTTAIAQPPSPATIILCGLLIFIIAIIFYRICRNM